MRESPKCFELETFAFGKKSAVQRGLVGAEVLFDFPSGKLAQLQAHRRRFVSGGLGGLLLCLCFPCRHEIA